MPCYIVVGMGFGDEGKGSTVDFLVRKHKADLVVRYNGGSQAAHNVVLQDGRHHTFCQFGSGTFVPGVRTHLSRFMLINPITMLNEDTYLQVCSGIENALDRVTIDKQALIITPFQKALNRLKAIASGQHNTCGQGIGQTRSDNIRYGNDVLFAGDLLKHNRAKDKLFFHRAIAQAEFYDDDKLKNFRPMHAEWEIEKATLFNSDVFPYLQIYSDFAKRVKFVDSLSEVISEAPIVFEGAQGILLDEKHGFQPHTTWTNTTCENAISLLEEIGYKEEIQKIGILRSYATRHGDGPFPSEDNSLKEFMEECYNRKNSHQGRFRVGIFDMCLTWYALQACPVDKLVINHVDMLKRLPKPYKIQLPGYDTISVGSKDAFLTTIEEMTRTPISILGYGPTAADRRIVT